MPQTALDAVGGLGDGRRGGGPASVVRNFSLQKSVIDVEGGGYAPPLVRRRVKGGKAPH